MATIAEPTAASDIATQTEIEASANAGAGPELASAVGWLFAALGFYLGARVIGDNSFLTHFVTGDLIRSQGAVPTTDPYSFTAAGESWTVQSWLASVSYSVLNDLGGGAAIRIANGVLTAALAAVVWRLTDRVQLLLARVVVVGAVVTLGATMWTPRPLLFGLVGFSLVLLALEGRLAVGWLVPAMWVWVNTHGSFPLALVAIGAFGVGRMIDERRLPRHEIRVFGWACLGVMTGALNPLGFRLLTFPVELLQRREALDGVREWKSPDFDSVTEWLFLALVLALGWAGQRRVGWRLLVPSIVFATAGFLAVRNIAVAALVLAMALAASLEGMTGTLTGRERSVMARGVSAMAVAGVVLVGLVTLQTGALDLTRYPSDEVDWLEERGLIASPDVNVIHRDFVGNYLHYRYGLDSRVFVDDRFDFYPQPVLDDHDDLLFGGDYQAVLDRHDADVVLWSVDGGFAQWLRDMPGWTIATEGENWMVATRAS